MSNLKFRAINTLTFEVLEQLYEGQRFQWVHSELQENIAINQYTGIKDIYDNEIYVGDIVKRTADNIGDADGDFYGVINMLEGCFWIDNGAEAVRLFTESAILEVKGNFYENKELLNET